MKPKSNPQPRPKPEKKSLPAVPAPPGGQPENDEDARAAGLASATSGTHPERRVPAKRSRTGK